MKHYYTYFNNFKYKSKVTDFERFLLSGGEDGQAESHLTENSDRITRLIDFNHYTSKDKLNFKSIERNVLWMNTILDNMELNENNKENYYTTFTIPKATGGVRTIEAPDEPLKHIQRSIVYLLKHKIYLLEHNNAHAYVEGKGIHTNAEYHRKSNHFAKVDFSNFFPKINTLFLKEILPKLGFFTNIFSEEGKDIMQGLLDLIIRASTLRDGLPQGAVTSPYLSNLIMIPFDYHMVEYLRKNHPNIIYTRYADDITFSSYYAFADRKEDAKTFVEGLVQHIINEHYTIDNDVMLHINHEKTRISTKFGKNRVTGIKINKDNKLSIGYKEKQELKQNLASLIIAKKKGDEINESHKDEILGMFAHLNNIEPKYARFVESRLLRKFNIQFRTIRRYLSN